MPLLVKSFFFFDFFLVFVYLLSIAYGGPFVFFTRLIDLDGEANLPSWYSSIQLFFVGILWSFLIYEKVEREDKSTWELLLIPILFLMLSLDESAQIHEYIGLKSDALLPTGRRSDTLFQETGIWMFLLPPFLIGLVFRLYVNAKRFFSVPKEISFRFMVGFLIFIGSAAGVEIFSNFMDWFLSLEIALEEGGEMMGVTILLWATWDLLRINLKTLPFEFGSGQS